MRAQVLVPVIAGISGVIVVVAIFSLMTMTSPHQTTFQIPSVLEADAQSGNQLVMSVRGFQDIPDGTQFQLTKLEHHVGTQSSGSEGSDKKPAPIKVCFNFADENSSCWIRVSAPMTGKNWGFLAIPRIGQEVTVNYVDGDPDRPIIIGTVYNNVKIESVELELSDSEKPMIKAIMSYGSNEIRFEDAASREQICIRTNARDHTTGFCPTSGPTAPTIRSFTPTSGPVGTLVTINGLNLASVTEVKFNGVSVNQPIFVVSAISIKAIVPQGATTGKISVTNIAGTAISAADFTVTPKINSFNPTSGPVGTAVTLTGTNFNDLISVKFGVVTAVVVSSTSTEIVATVPATATTGKISVTTIDGTAISAADFIVT